MASKQTKDSQSALQEAELRYKAPAAANVVLKNDPRPKKDYLTALRDEDLHYVMINFRVPQRNFQRVISMLIMQKLITHKTVYSAESLRLWTKTIRVRAMSTTTMGSIFKALIVRLGLGNAPVKFCLDGFFGLSEYGNIFGKVNAVPWMEISPMATVASLKLSHCDSVFINIPTMSQIEMAELERSNLERAEIENDWTKSL